MAILIKRYANRKLYNTDTSRYITLKGIAALLDDGLEIRVIDNETGDDITQVALSQILVDNKRAHQDPSETLLSQILTRGGDALYGAIRKSVDEATEGIGDFQDRFRDFVGQADSKSRSEHGLAWDKPSGQPSSNEAQTDGMLQKDLDQLIGETVKQVIESFDIPSRKDLDALSRQIEGVAKAVERLEQAYLPDEEEATQVSKHLR
ncbi:MAG: polyhydroxyalkanoate synthesis regulator DNA-binding domain-containing protein [Myxococcota bacterium]